MNSFNVDECMRAFVQFCENADKTGLVDDVEYQYWVFEQGYIAALNVMASPTECVTPLLKLAA